MVALPRVKQVERLGAEHELGWVLWVLLNVVDLRGLVVPVHDSHHDEAVGLNYFRKGVVHYHQERLLDLIALDVEKISDNFFTLDLVVQHECLVIKHEDLLLA